MTSPAHTSAGHDSSPQASSTDLSAGATGPSVLLRHGAGRGTLTGVGLVLAGTVSVQFGSAFAALLFPRAGALGT
ncbi:MAG: EamA family transporter, partial [Streptomyces sp.]